VKDLEQEIEELIDRHCFVPRVEKQMLVWALARLVQRRVQETVAGHLTPKRN
jgi:hypothetical protein